MKSIGLIEANIDGPKVCNCIGAHTYKHIKQMFDVILNESLLNDNKDVVKI